MKDTVLRQLSTQCGQRIWLDTLSRSFIERGELAQWINLGASGVTSNPSIFYDAIAKDPAYQSKLEKVRIEYETPQARYEALVLPDVQDACDLLMPVYNQCNKKTGYVSMEVSPELADDADKTIEAALELWTRINRKNAMIKIPATVAGLSAIEACIAEGLNVNVTLIFSQEQLNGVQNAYLNGIRKRLKNEKSVEDIQSVMSLFLSRTDTLIDPKIPDEYAYLRGKTAISIAKMAYQNWLTDFIPQLATVRPARPQYLLWASTGTKNKAYSDILYVQSLIGPDTINTLPLSTLNNVLDHGEATPNTLTQNVDEARAALSTIAELGFNLEEIGNQLQDAGVKIFKEAYAKLLTLVE